MAAEKPGRAVSEHNAATMAEHGGLVTGVQRTFENVFSGMCDAVFDRLPFERSAQHRVEPIADLLQGRWLRRDRRARCTAGAHPLIDLRKLELPQTSDPVCRQALVLDPAVDGVFRDAEVLGHRVDGHPGFGRHCPTSFAKWHDHRKSIRRIQAHPEESRPIHTKVGINRKLRSIDGQRATVSAVHAARRTATDGQIVSAGRTRRPR